MNSTKKNYRAIFKRLYGYKPVFNSNGSLMTTGDVVYLVKRRLDELKRRGQTT